jgi:hypothetical protein
MIFTWKILELFAEAKSVNYFASATDGKNTVEQMGNYIYPEGLVNLPVDQIKEFHLIEWIDKKEIELNLENQLNSFNLNNKIELPWLVDTFTPES